MTPLFLVKKLHPLAKVPVRATAGAIGYDLYGVEDVSLLPGAWSVVKTGIAMAIPDGYYGRIAARSGWAARYGIAVNAGVIDNDYRGEIGVVLMNLGDEAFIIEAGNRIAQLIFERADTPNLIETVEDLPGTFRADGGYGSTGA